MTALPFAADPPEQAHTLDSSIRKLIARMRSQPEDEFRTETAAGAVGVTSFAFIRAFKALTGLSPQRFHAALRIARAKRLLVETDRSVTDISLDVGYNSLGTFIRTFNALIGVPPRQLRRLARGEAMAIALLDAFVAPPRTGPVIHATIEPPLPTGTLIAAGLFPQGLPAGLPFDGCFVDPSMPSFSLMWPKHRRRASLLAAAVGPFDLREAWAGQMGEVWVCNVAMQSSSCDTETAPVRLRLRPLEDTDPPFLTPVPLLMLM